MGKKYLCELWESVKKQARSQASPNVYGHRNVPISIPVTLVFVSTKKAWILVPVCVFLYCLHTDQPKTKKNSCPCVPMGGSQSYFILNYFAISYFILNFLPSYLTNMVIKGFRSNHTSYLIFGPNHTSYLFFYPNHT